MIEPVRAVPQDELAEWRRRGPKPGHTRESYTIGSNRPASVGTGDEAQMPLPSFRPAAPKKAAETQSALVLGSMLKNRDTFAQLMKTMRHQFPNETAHMTDEQLAEFAEKVYRQRMQEATNKAFVSTGRARELQIKTAGY